MVVKLELNRITELSEHDGYNASAVVTIWFYPIDV